MSHGRRRTSSDLRATSDDEFINSMFVTMLLGKLDAMLDQVTFMNATL